MTSLTLPFSVSGPIPEIGVVTYHCKPSDPQPPQHCSCARAHLLLGRAGVPACSAQLAGLCRAALLLDMTTLIIRAGVLILRRLHISYTSCNVPFRLVKNLHTLRVGSHFNRVQACAHCEPILHGIVLCASKGVSAQHAPCRGVRGGWTQHRRTSSTQY